MAQALGSSMASKTLPRQLQQREKPLLVPASPPKGHPQPSMAVQDPSLAPGASRIVPLPSAKFPLAQGFALAFQDLFVPNLLPNKVQRRLL